MAKAIHPWHEDKNRKLEVAAKISETKQKQVKNGIYVSWNRGKHGVQDYSGNGQKISNALKGRKLSGEHKRNMSEAMKKRWRDKEYVEKMHRSMVGHPVSEETKQKLRGDNNPFYGKKHTKEELYKMSDRAKEHWRNEETAKKMIMGLQMKPNKAELFLDSILQEYFPDEWKFVGDGQVIIGGLCPDFINCNGKKKIIELFGARWHDPVHYHVKYNQTEEGRKSIFGEIGFDTLVIWYPELKNKTKVIEKIKVFTYG